MRSTIRHAAVLAAAVAMFAAIAVPAQARPRPATPDLFEVECDNWGEVSAVAADESTRLRELWLIGIAWDEELGLWRMVSWSPEDYGRGLLEVELPWFSPSDWDSQGRYRVQWELWTETKRWGWIANDGYIEGVCLPS